MESAKYTGLEVAIIGMSGRFPGANDTEVLWENLCNGVESISRFSKEELLQNGVNSELFEDPNYIPAKGIIEDSELFEEEFFGYTQREASLMDPQIRLFHEGVWHALENAGYDPYNYKKRIGIFAGATANPFWHAAALSTEFAGIAQIVADKDYICTRIANALDLKGPAVFVQTACSTSLVAVHMACRSLLTGDCEMALAGGIGFTVPHKIGYLYQDGMIGSSDGHCRAFDARADGMVGGEGYGIVLLKPLKKAMEDKDHIHAIIKGSAINNDGKAKISFAAPSLEGQASAVQIAHKVSRVPVASISFIEAHGTGTYIGDPIEVKALTKAFGNQVKKQFCYLGSIKTNIGHLDHASGVTGLIKAVLCLKNKKIPPTLNYQTPNPELNLENSPFIVNNKLIDWEKSELYPRRAAVNSLGIGGTNAYVILEEAPEKILGSENRPWYILPISARTSASLIANQHALSEFIEKHHQYTTLSDISYTLAVGRKSFAYRDIIICKDHNQATNLLSASQSNKRIVLEENKVTKIPEQIIFMFPGQGTQYLNMFLDLYRESSVFKTKLDDCFTILSQKGYPSFEKYLFDIKYKEVLRSNTAIAQPVLFSVEYALAQLLIDIGIKPTACVGHSLGEYVAACLAGIMSLDDALYVVAERGRLMQSLSEGEMLSIAMSAEDTRPLIKDSLSIAAINGSKSTVISGSKPLIADMKVKLDNLGVRHVVINPDHAFHSDMVDSISDKFACIISEINLYPARIPVASNLSGTWIKETESTSIEYWVNHMRNTVQFSSNIDTVCTLKNTILIEVGPGNILARLVKQRVGIEPLAVISVGKNECDEENDYYCFLQSIGQLWKMGLSINWDQFFGGLVKKIPLPNYMFNARIYNFELLTGLKNPCQIYEPISDVGSIESLESGILKDLCPLSQEVSQAVAQAFTSTLGIESMDYYEDFFVCGGDSYTVMIVIAKIHKMLDVLVPLKVFFNSATIDSITEYVSNAEKDTHIGIKAADIRNSYPLSPAQLRLYIVQQTELNNVGYNESLETLIIGEVNKSKLENAFNQVIERHESLRTSFIVNDYEIVQVIQPQIDFKIHYLQSSDDKVGELLNSFIKPFDLGKAPLLRACLITINEQRHILIVDFHHIIIDAASMGVVFNELIEYYEGKVLEPLNIQYKDFVVWQSFPHYQKIIKKQQAYWFERFKHSPLPDLELPLDYARPDVRSFNGGSVFSSVGTEEIKFILNTENVSLFMFLFAILNILLSRLGGVQDLAVGTVIAGRRHTELENIVGVFVNMLVIRSNPKLSISFKDYLQQIKKLSLEAFENQEFQYEELIQNLNLKRDPGRNALFDVAFVLQNTAEFKDEVKAGGVSFMPYIRDKGVAKFDLTLTVVEDQDQGLHLRWDYSKDLFSQSTIVAFADAYLKIVNEVLNNSNIQLSEINMFDLFNHNSEVKVGSDLESNLDNWEI
ncbi:condensation domain-containing protein [Psychrobacter aquimaris]|uniref:condensation domain-containing protein n=1 Tax=Psychrobacter aquimaris TaxID=292733 RepID=UPI003FD149FC